MIISFQKNKLDDTVNDEFVKASNVVMKPSDNIWIPFHLMAVWKEPGTTLGCIKVAIILPSGVEKGDLNVKVVEDGDFLKLKVY